MPKTRLTNLGQDVLDQIGQDPSNIKYFLDCDTN